MILQRLLPGNHDGNPNHNDPSASFLSQPCCLNAINSNVCMHGAQRERKRERENAYLSLYTYTHPEWLKRRASEAAARLVCGSTVTTSLWRTILG
ncbi:hypothetical protein TNIN_119731 [Trichonephila inaurata madagascariensis]|uniref:Uncharacterized protein n=1 Tax=Trichonephila inaurata madagascariensis TaxID=2747483 RepID=A0A8X6YKV8_9ARAC|nr:hypothetical protein TNIN_119731 [Trichonephila inaurata madagascariensis]